MGEFADIDIYPNPSQDFLLIDIVGIDSPITFSIFNLKGQCVVKETIFKNGKIDMSQLAGFYLLKIEYDEEVLVREIISF